MIFVCVNKYFYLSNTISVFNEQPSRRTTEINSSIFNKKKKPRKISIKYIVIRSCVLTKHKTQFERQRKKKYKLMIKRETVMMDYDFRCLYSNV